MSGMEMEFELFTVMFILFCVIATFPPQEVANLGLTVEGILGPSILGDEQIDFILYNIRRTSATIIFHGSLPLIYVILTCWIYPDQITKILPGNADSSFFWQLYVIAATSLLTAIITKVFYQHSSPTGSALWSGHPVAILLNQFAVHLELPSWKEVANQLDQEYRDIDKFSSLLGGWNSHTVVTRHWIIRIGRYKLNFAHQHECALEIIESDEHSVSQQGDLTGAQYLTIKVRSHVQETGDFFLRLNAREFDDFKRRVLPPIHIPAGIMIRRSLAENFLVLFRQQVAENEMFSPDEIRGEIESCIGCYISLAEVKLIKRCDDVNCESCRCRPMWCINCMGLWFAHQQNQQLPETWMHGSAPCPNCRCRFCLLDVCPLPNAP